MSIFFLDVMNCKIEKNSHLKRKNKMAVLVEIEVWSSCRDLHGLTTGWGGRATRGHVKSSVCLSLAGQWDSWETWVRRPLPSPHLQPPPRITVPFKATQHLFPPIKTNNLCCWKSRQLLSAGAENLTGWHVIVVQ